MVEVAGEVSAPGAGLSAVANLRDIGGHELSNGSRIADGVVFRSSHLQGLSAQGEALLARLGVGTAVDLRSAAERAGGDYQLPSGATAIWLDVLADNPASAAAFSRLFADGQLHSITAEDTETFMLNSYRDMVELPSARHAYRRTFEVVADPSSGVVVIHCTAGKDRTGWASAALQLWLGMDEAAVRADYLRSNEAQPEMIADLVAAFVAAGGDPVAVENLVTVRPDYLDMALQQVSDRHGTVEEYLRNGLALSDETLGQLRDRMVIG